MASVDLHTLEEGARSLGANFRQRFFGVVLPNCWSGVVAGSLMVLTLSIGEPDRGGQNVCGQSL